MHQQPEASGLDTVVTSMRAVLASQYHAALAMLRQGIEKCPDQDWASDQHVTACWQLAYHTLFFAHLYIQTEEEAFSPWVHHRADAQYPDGIAGPPDPDSELPLLAPPYSRSQALEYWRFCDDMVDSALEEMDILSPDSGFSWYPVSKLEHQLVNIRHIQHGAAQLADRVRATAGIGIDWAGARPSRN